MALRMSYATSWPMRLAEVLLTKSRQTAANCERHHGSTAQDKKPGIAVDADDLAVNGLGLQSELDSELDQVRAGHREY